MRRCDIGPAQNRGRGRIDKDSTGASASPLIVLGHGAYLLRAGAASVALSPLVDQRGLTGYAIMPVLSPTWASRGLSWPLPLIANAASILGALLPTA